MMRGVLAVAAFALAGTAHAGEICYGPASATGAAPPTAGTIFTCPTAGSGTLDQLAGLGWRIVRLTPVSLGGDQIAAQLVIRRVSDAIFASGFET